MEPGGDFTTYDGDSFGTMLVAAPDPDKLSALCTNVFLANSLGRGPQPGSQVRRVLEAVEPLAIA